MGKVEVLYVVTTVHEQTLRLSNPMFLAIDGRSVIIEITRTEDGPLLTLKPGEGTSLEGEMPGEYYLVASEAPA